MLPMPPVNDYWDVWARLWERSTGGSDVAAQPDQPVDDYWPTGLRPPGVEECLSWLAGQSGDGLPKWLFLLGGPGAGKSHATSAATEGMELATSMDDGLASRSYEYSGSQSDLFVINDATISSESEETPLVDDLNKLAFEAIQAIPTYGKQRNLIACVNRGILIEELANVRRFADLHQSGNSVLEWLNGDENPDGSSPWQISQHKGEFLVRSAVLVYREVPIANLLVVSVDECSLFERRPLVSIIGDRVQTISEYELTLLEKRQEIPEETMPAADLLARVIGRFDGVEASGSIAADPLMANLENLRKSEIRSSLCTVARAGELITSSRMTYREVWGFLVRSFVGNAPQNMAASALRKHLQQLQPNGSSVLEDFNKIRSLANFRLHQSIFGGTGLATKEMLNDPVLRITNAADPLRDALPGRSHSDPQRGWATPIAEALTSQMDEESPLQVLVRYDHNGRLDAVVTDFDRMVDDYYYRAWSGNDLTDVERNNMVEWYGKYLTRMYAFAFGIPAFRAEVSMLIQACRQKDHLPDRLQEPMRTLIRPRRNSDAAISESLIPLYDSRTDPIIGRPAVPKLAIRVGDFELRLAKESVEQSMLTIHRDGKLMAKMTLDFALVREALACSGDSSGVTDLVDVTAPRLERIRASRLLPKQLPGTEVRIVEGGSGHQVSVPWKAQDE